jgi:putative membrane protein
VVIAVCVTDITSTGGDRRFWLFNALVSGAAVLFLGWLLYGRGQSSGEGVDLRFMPAVNASLNALTATLLTCGWVAIKRGKQQLHRYLMTTAFVVAALFLVGYIAYHAAHGDTKYTGQGALRTLYFAVLISHVLLSMVTLPLAIAALTFALQRKFVSHKKVTKWLFPMWLYVSVTGVTVFFMLRGMPVGG